MPEPREPIWVRCEGSGCPTHFPEGTGICSMCGRTVICDDDGRAIGHRRTDVLAMIERGDFDA